jgi:protocatechuate 4,5-dioxygenase alpha chain
MSRYATNRVLWEATADGDLARRIHEDPATALSSRDLTDDERSALAKTDVRSLFLLGVHPFLLYNYALRQAGGFSMPFLQSYLDQLQGLEVGELDT